MSDTSLIEGCKAPVPDADLPAAGAFQLVQRLPRAATKVSTSHSALVRKLTLSLAGGSPIKLASLRLVASAEVAS